MFPTAPTCAGYQYVADDDEVLFYAGVHIDPVPGAWVLFYDQSGNFLGYTTTDAYGNYAVLAYLPDGIYYVAAVDRSVTWEKYVYLSDGADNGIMY